ncbi:YlbE-like family protein [Oceanobacillus luteolus]|uniref:YlbE-like family protein n=1 Tax=Oceanobacillus luteolus TaxID=1274358 RepID=A0ABW4HQH8_9BACI|nr:YlbE-like family protein [Oceanobacillus luteolus]MCM3742251.1 YlbE-like family protein [Oceanobacillus luteolus]
MDLATYQYLQNNPRALEFIRLNPIWYRYLSRDGVKRTQDLEKEVKIFFGQTFSGRLNRMNDQVQMASMLIQVANILKD